ncbi:hypothetical protein [Streptomyces sp. Caat 7-52]|uniref:hypothetical protein n=1 Tax=Streptomyces sp. Caat 7-52 TaxID=2949637 RepID=UPI00203643FA|nr:hypothetical protein [Streptomyces sp. Caat 7-52]
MTPRLRLTFRRLRLLAVLTVAALPLYGVAVAYGSTAAYPAGPDPARVSATGHGEEERGPTGHASPDRSDPRHPAAEHSPPHHSAPVRGHPEEQRPRHEGPSPEPSAPDGLAQPDPATPVPMPSDSASASVLPYLPLASASPSRAGSRAGEGRMRPGRPDGPSTEVEGDDDPAPATQAAQPAEPETTNLPTAYEPSVGTGLDSATPPLTPDARQAAERGEAATEPVLRILPLGSGLVLIGLGLGLAFLGLRLRRS